MSRSEVARGRATWLSMALTSLMLGAACTMGCGDSSQASSDAGPVCPQPLPDACPTTAPSYHSDIAPLIEKRCLMCHGPGGIAYPVRDFTSYDKIFARRTTVLNELYTCSMPPASATPLTASELDTLQTWFVCGAPNN